MTLSSKSGLSVYGVDVSTKAVSIASPSSKPETLLLSTKHGRAA